MKDKYPIPIVDDLLDELHGAVVLRQVIIKSELRLKMCTKQHSGLTLDIISLRLLPFGLTNAPATFQALMNRVFQLYLSPQEVCFGVFYDILIYSKSLPEHVDHLLLVINTLIFHSLYAKRSKSSFGQSKVEYL